MATIGWSDALSVGIPEIDDEHRALVETLNALEKAATSQDQSAVAGYLEVIGKHAIDHFAHEERLMRRAGYSGYLWHRRQHQTAKARLGRCLETAKASGDCEGLIAFLKAWLPEHIGLHDRMMAASVRNYRRRLGCRKAVARPMAIRRSV